MDNSCSKPLLFSCNVLTVVIFWGIALTVYGHAFDWNKYESSNTNFRIAGPIVIGLA
jgi:hypothetical protein